MLKTVSSVINAIGALNYQGTWDAATNTPTLTSSVGTKGDYYVVSVAGSTNLDGTTLWGVGDWAVFNGSIWQKVDGGSTGDFTNLSVSGTATFSGQLANSVMFLNASKNLATDSSFSYDGVNGRLGIGTSSPSDRLHVYQNADDNIVAKFENAASNRGSLLQFSQVTTGSVAAPVFYIGQGGDSTGDAILNNASNTAMKFYTNNTLRATIDNAGNLGLGVTPSSWGTFKALQVGYTNIGGFTTANNAFLSSNAYYSGTGWIYQGSYAATYYQQLTGQHIWYTAAAGTAGNAISFTQAMTLNSSGNLGIGTSSPGYRLDVQAGPSGTANNSFIYFARTSGASSGYGDYIQTGGAATGAWFGRKYLTSPGWVSSLIGSNAILFSTGDIGSETERMRLDSSGNLGIGTSSITDRLTVAGNATLSVTQPAYGLVDTSNSNYKWILQNLNSAIRFYDITSGAERMRIDSAGNVGIGTSSPSFRLHVAGGNIYLDTGYNYTAATGGGYWASGSATPYVTGWYESSGNMLFRTSSSTKMTLDSSGNLGLGVTPSAWSVYKAYQVGRGALINASTETDLVHNAYWNGTNWIYNSTDFASRHLQINGQHRFYTAASGTAGNTISFTQAMTLDASGNLGVGTTSPSDRLHVNSSSASTYVRVTNTTGDRTFIGSENGLSVIYAQTSAGAVAPLAFISGASERMRIDANGNVQVGTAAIATNATNGFFYIPTCAGTPTGTPTAKTGLAPMVIDSTNNKMYIYSGGAWVALN